MRSPEQLVTRLLRTAILCLATYCVLGMGVGLAWIGVLALPTSVPVLQALSEADFLPAPTGTVTTSVRNIFGDPVPGARLRLAGFEVESGASGQAVFPEIPIGLHELQIHAPGYQTLSVDLRIAEGHNEPLIKFDRGLWPTGFAADFHAFFQDEESAEQRIFLQIGIANGSDDPVYIRGFQIVDKEGLPVTHELETSDGYRRLVFMHAALALATGPYALILKERSYANIELRPVVAQPTHLGELRLIVEHAARDGHLRGDYHSLEITTTPVQETDLNPHRP